MTKAHLSDRDLARLREKLEHERAKLLRAERVERDVGRGVSEQEIEDGDVAERMIEQEGALRLVEFDRAMLEDVDRALAKLEAGTYGTSEDSGKPIPLDRLDAVPWARRTADEEARHPRGR